MLSFKYRIEMTSQKASATMQVAAMPPQGQEFDLDTMPPLTYYLLLQKLRQRKLPMDTC